MREIGEKKRKSWNGIGRERARKRRWKIPTKRLPRMIAKIRSKRKEILDTPFKKDTSIIK